MIVSTWRIRDSSQLSQACAVKSNRLQAKGAAIINIIMIIARQGKRPCLLSASVKKGRRQLCRWLTTLRSNVSLLLKRLLTIKWTATQCWCHHQWVPMPPKKSGSTGKTSWERSTNMQGPDSVIQSCISRVGQAVLVTWGTTLTSHE